MKELIVEAKNENLEKVQDFVRAELENCPPKLRAQLSIVVDEIFSNIACYAYAQQGGQVTVRLALVNDITIEFEDSGMPYDPLEKPDPNTTLDVDEREIGGLGIFMVKSLMDSVRYRRIGNKNLLTIKRNMETIQ